MGQGVVTTPLDRRVLGLDHETLVTQEWRKSALSAQWHAQDLVDPPQPLQICPEDFADPRLAEASEDQGVEFIILER